MVTQNMGLIGEIRAGGAPKLLYDLITPDFSRRPSRPNLLFNDENKYPTCSTIYNQRRIFISTRERPLDVYASAVGKYTDFSFAESAAAAFTLTLDSYSYDPINFAVASQFGLLLFSERNVWMILSREGGGISASSAFIKSELLSGSKKDLAPLPVLNNILFMSNLDNTPRLLVPVNTTPNQFTTQDLSLYSHHLFDVTDSFIEGQTVGSTFDPRHRSGAEIISWTYAGRPNRLVWAVRADGTLLSCTYAPEHQVNAWSKHSTKGRFRAVQSVYEKNVDTTYVIVERGGHKFIECFANVSASDLEQSTPFDAAVRTVNVEPTELTKLEIHYYENGVRKGNEDDDDDESVSGWGSYDGLGATLTGDGYDFSFADEGRLIRTPGGIYKIDDRRANNRAEISVIREVPESDHSYFVHGTSYRHPIYHWEVIGSDTVYNAFHLQNQEVHCVEYDSAGELKLVQDKSVGSNGELSAEAGALPGLVAGLPFESTVKLLPITHTQFAAENKDKTINQVGLRCLDSSSMMASASGTPYPVFFDGDGFPDIKFRSGVFNVDVGGEWEIDESLCLMSKLPFNILGVVISYDLGGDPNARNRLRGEFAI